MTRTGAWIEGMRLRTLPVSAAGVIAAVGCVSAGGADVAWGWAAVCLLFALLAQIASNFANEYFDFKAGIDGDGRRGPERGVANGIITPRAMLAATLITLGAACAVGLLTVARGGWWLIPAGAAIALGALAYSAGPYPLSRHRLGEAAAVIFYGIVPVCLTYYVLTLQWSWSVLICGIAVGLWVAMVMLVNNYRDITSDRACGKNTLSTTLGPQGSALLYCALGQFAAIGLFVSNPGAWSVLPVIPAALGFLGGHRLFIGGLSGAQCTRLLAITASSLLLTTLLFLLLASL